MSSQHTSVRDLTPNGPPCKRCGCMMHERRERTGFVQRRLLGALKLYPWACAYCSKVTYCAARTSSELRLTMYLS